MKRRCMRRESAVSPVIGVMLMLVVTIIIAAVVSGFAGGMIGNADKAPSLTMDVSIKNSGYYSSSNFEAKVISVSEPIDTSKLKIVTSWTNSSGITGGAIVNGTANVFNWTIRGGFENMTAPWGYGPGVSKVNSGIPGEFAQQFGNYTLLGGTTMYAVPAGQAGGYGGLGGTSGYGIDNQYYYTGWSYSPGSIVDGMQAVLGPYWESLRTGDVVKVKMVYLPTGSTIFDKEVVVS